MSLDYNQLEGPQRKVLRLAILKAFDYDMDALALAIADHGGLRGLGYYASANLDADLRLGTAISKMRRQASLDQLVAAVRASDFAANPELLNLDDRLGLLTPEDAAEPAAGEPAMGDVFQRQMAGYDDEEVFLWTDTLLTFAAAMAQITYPAGPARVHGTGIALSNETVLTNEHVISPLLQGRADPADAVLSFNLALTRKKAATVKTMTLATGGWDGLRRPPSAADFNETAFAEAHELDYAMLSVLGEATPDATVSLSKAVEPPEVGGVLLILHHPAGQPLKLSLGVSLGLHGPNRLRYKAHTVGGSSGGLVLDAKLRPIALHHAGDPIKGREATYNQGIPFTLIAEDLAGRGHA